MLKEPSSRAAAGMEEDEVVEEVKPAAEEKKDDQGELKRKYSFCKVLKRILHIARRMKCLVVLGLLVAAAYGSTWPLLSLVLSRMMITLGRGDFSESNFLSYMFLVLAVGTFLIVFSMNYTYDLLAMFITKDFRLRTYESVLRKEIGWHDDSAHSAGAVAGLMAGETTKINGAIGRGAGNFLMFLVALTVGGVIALVGEWHIGLLMIALMPLFVFSSFINNKQQKRILFAQTQRFKEASGLVSEAVVSMKTIRSFSGEEKVLSLYSELINKPYKMSLKESKRSALLQAFSQSVTYFVFGIGFIVGDAMAREGWIANRADIFTPVFAIMFASFGSQGSVSFAA